MDSFDSPIVTHLGGGQTTAELTLQHFGSILTGSGILTPTSFTVSALPSPGMKVQVSGSSNDDKAVIITDSGETYFIKNLQNAEVTILANSSGVTKTDAIVLYVDLLAGDPNNAGSPGAAKLIAVRHDEAGVGTGAPTDGEIDAATGNNPWLKLRHVTVTHNTGEIEETDLSYEAARSQISKDILELIGPDQLSNVWWEELGRHVLTSAGSIISVTIPNKRYLQILIDAGDTGLSSQVHLLRFNDDSGGNYAYKRSVDGAADSNDVNISQFDGGINVAGLNKFSTAWVNNGATEKVIMLQAITSNTAGAGTAPRRAELYGKWVNPNPITKVSLTRNSGTFSAGSRIIVLGHD